MPKAKNAQSEISIYIYVEMFEMQYILNNAVYFHRFTIACRRENFYH